MKRYHCLILGLSTLLTLTNCYTSSSSNSSVGSQSVNTVAANVSAMTSVALYANPPIALSGAVLSPAIGVPITWTASTGNITYVDPQTNATKTCTLPTATLNQIDSFWSRAQICVSQYINTNPPPTIACPAIALIPLAIFTDPTQSYILTANSVATECFSRVYYICDPTDQADLETISASIYNQLSSLSCQ